MSIRVNTLVTVVATQDIAGTEKLFAPDEESQRIFSDDWDQQASGTFQIINGQSWAIPMGDIGSPKGLYVSVAQAVKIDVNGLGQFTVVLPKSGSPAKFFVEAEITGVVLTNNTGGVATGVWCAWGTEA